MPVSWGILIEVQKASAATEPDDESRKQPKLSKAARENIAKAAKGSRVVAYRGK